MITSYTVNLTRPVESFFGTLKRELVYHRHYGTRDEAKQDIFEYIEVFYNPINGCRNVVLLRDSLTGCG